MQVNKLMRLQEFVREVEEESLTLLKQVLKILIS